MEGDNNVRKDKGNKRHVKGWTSGSRVNRVRPGEGGQTYGVAMTRQRFGLSGMKRFIIPLVLANSFG